MKITDVLNITTTNNKAEININGIIGYTSFWEEENSNTTKESVEKELKAFKELDEDIEEIILNIDSPGGSVSHALKIFYLLDQHKATKKTIYTGVSASAATIIGSVSDIENITIPEYNSILIHEARFSDSDNYTVSKLENAASDLKKINKQIATIYAKLNGKSIEENLSLMAQNNGEGILMTAEEAKELGFVGNVSKINEKIAALDITKFMGWSDANLNKLLSINNKNRNEMGFLNKKKKFQAIETEKGKLIVAEIKNGVTGELIDSDEIVNGEYTFENKVITVKDNEITNVIERDLNAIAIDELRKEISALKAENIDLKGQLSNLANEVSEEINEINGTLEKAKLSVSAPKLPKEDVSSETIAETKKELSAYELQKLHDQNVKLKLKK